MNNEEISRRFASLTTPHLADACVRAGLPVRCASTGLTCVVAHGRVSARVLPVQHAGSVDVFLEAFDEATPGDVLVVDNGGRLDEACVGDLVVHEAKHAGLSGIVIWGLHRDSVEIREIGLPVFSLGSLPNGPLAVVDRSADALSTARVGEWLLSASDLVFGDDDGILFVPGERADDVLGFAETIRDTEIRQAQKIRAGTSLRAQVHFGDYLSKRASLHSLTFREHLRDVGGEIEV
jgi:regulator of RNase E activity RraA